jgi:hypothetical protein
MSPRITGGQGLPKHHIRIDLEGLDAESGHIRISDFLATVKHFAGMLTNLDRLESGDGKLSFYLRVVDLGRDSPAHITLEEVLISPETDRRESVTSDFLKRLTSIEMEETEGLDYDFLRKAGELSKPMGESMKAASVSINGDQFFVDAGFREHVANKLSPEETAEGFIRGMLEYINIHSDRPVFCVYPDIGPKKVTCHFGTDLLSEARSGIGRFVEVRGVLKYKAAARYAHEITAQRIKVLPPDEELPRFAELRGAFPDLTDGVPAEQYIRQIRDAADEV